MPVTALPSAISGSRWSLYLPAGNDLGPPKFRAMEQKCGLAELMNIRSGSTDG
jgi:hypothetical protein